ncbi:MULTISPECIES: tRNA pseudouridine(38-40) synthase TruA [unclassified Erysipelothrix]|uniref:tRNA pseudouridine(38-40) synthase TruA n=1 Tax=unclassified Erysipelothrix TaxID=2624170 RepID=UPI001376C243|nr:tRNA pseudouridine(38-40) synthase TruA [Erysipelothrix sp. strain 2 (EsS2-6-Brazil)]MBK2402763.1 tRNA pseudouridine(38-40) synthase TruA [Erysipelothrix sp. strain 2 (EsS2-6-Brazil)]NBA01743.1 tRNA pseudouridine(38-40) synthase TruA [Erysipelothrix rhusiopathiae]
MRFKATVQYDGSMFKGWQKQPSGRCIQTEIESVLTRINKVPIHISGSGRTDAGVHALGQVFHFDNIVNMDEKQLFRALNTLLPDDISITDIHPVHSDFHARFDVVSKTYEYRLNMGSYNLFERNYVYQYNKSLDLQAVREAMQVFIGTHDFTSFNATGLDEIENQVRTITDFDLIVAGDQLSFVVSGDGFLRYMVRMIVATCVACGSGKCTPHDINLMLKAADKNSVSYNIDACGLYLKEVNYK